MKYFTHAAVLLCLPLLAACNTTSLGDLPERLASPTEAALPAMNRFGSSHPEVPTRSNTEIARDILDLSFEMESGRPIPVMSRFEGPITVTVVPGAPSTLIPDLDQLIARLRNEAHINIRRINHGAGPASITIEALPRARMQRAVPQAACFVVPRASSWDEFQSIRRTNGLDWTTLITRERVAVFVPNNVSPQEIRDCLHEEVSQGLGPLNDLYRLHDSIFNDDNFQAVLTGFDMIALRAYYDPALRSGMTRAQMAAQLPGILARINPGGQHMGGAAAGATDRAWITAIEEALGGRASTTRRIASAREAVSIASTRGWRDNRMAFSHFALGRLTIARDADLSIASFITAGRMYQRIAPNGIQIAHVNMQLAAFALSSGQATRALDLVNEAMPAATRAENATLLATMLMIKAEALEVLGRPAEARTVRLDSLGWGRYGFAGDAAVRERLTEVAALAPRT